MLLRAPGRPVELPNTEVYGRLSMDNCERDTSWMAKLLIDVSLIYLGHPSDDCPGLTTPLGTRNKLETKAIQVESAVGTTANGVHWFALSWALVRW